MQIIKISRNAAWAICLGIALSVAGCNGNGKTSGSDTAKTDTAKADTMKMAPADTGATPPGYVPKKDTTGKPRPLVRKT